MNDRGKDGCGAGPGASPGAKGGLARRTGGLVVLLAALGLSHLSGQEITGRVLDGSNGQAVQTAGVFLLDTARQQVAVSIADSVGRFVLRAPASGEYYLAVQRIGYFEMETPLVAVTDRGRYALDLEIRPEPIALDPLLVSVRNDQLTRWMKRRFARNPAEDFGFRVIQGLRLEEARLKSENNTDLLRWLYVPVSHMAEACTGSRMPTVERGTQRIIPPECGKVIIDDIPYPAEHLDDLDMSEIGVVVVMGQDVMVFTRAFDWNTLPAPGR